MADTSSPAHARETAPSLIGTNARRNLGSPLPLLSTAWARRSIGVLLETTTHSLVLCLSLPLCLITSTRSRHVPSCVGSHRYPPFYRSYRTRCQTNLVVRYRDQMVCSICHGLAPLEVEHESTAVWPPWRWLHKFACQFVSSVRRTERYSKQRNVSSQ